MIENTAHTSGMSQECTFVKDVRPKTKEGPVRLKKSDILVILKHMNIIGYDFL